MLLKRGGGGVGGMLGHSWPGSGIPPASARGSLFVRIGEPYAVTGVAHRIESRLVKCKANILPPTLSLAKMEFWGASDGMLKEDQCPRKSQTPTTSCGDHHRIEFMAVQWRDVVTLRTHPSILWV